jgi:hypothetical protein
MEDPVLLGPPIIQEVVYRLVLNLKKSFNISASSAAAKCLFQQIDLPFLKPHFEFFVTLATKNNLDRILLFIYGSSIKILTSSSIFSKIRPIFNPQTCRKPEVPSINQKMGFVYSIGWNGAFSFFNQCQNFFSVAPLQFCHQNFSRYFW